MWPRGCVGVAARMTDSCSLATNVVLCASAVRSALAMLLAVMVMLERPAAPVAIWPPAPLATSCVTGLRIELRSDDCVDSSCCVLCVLGGVLRCDVRSSGSSIAMSAGGSDHARASRPKLREPVDGFGLAFLAL